MHTTVSAGASYTDNASASSDGDSDVIYRISPTLVFQSKPSALQVDASAGVNISRHIENDDNDSEGVRLSLNANYPNQSDAPYSAAMNFGIRENTGGDSEFGAITRNRNFSASGGLSYQFSRRFFVSTSVGYNRTQPLDSGDSLASNRSETYGYSLGLSAGYRYSEVLSYGFGYGFGTSSSDAASSTESNSHSVSASFNGELTPVIAGSLSLGAQLSESQSSFRESVDDISPYVSGNLSWQLSELTSCSMSFATTFQTSTANQSSQSHTSSVNINHSFSNSLNGTLGLSLSQTDYLSNDETIEPDREDRNWGVNAGFSRRLGNHSSVSITLDYSQNRSSQSITDADSLTAGLNFQTAF